MTSRPARIVVAAAAAALATSALNLIAASPAGAAPNVVQATFYASPTGTGTVCSNAAPCSLESARDKVRTVNSNMTGDIVVKLKTGTYRLSSTLTLTESATIHDSGTNGFNVIYQKDTGAIPILSGGETVTGFTLYDASKNIYRASVSAGLNTRQLYVGGVRATRARSAGNPSFAQTATGYTLPSTGTYATIATWGNVSHIEVATANSWKHARYSVASISGNAMTMDPAGWNDGNTQPDFPTRNMQWIENAYELLDTAGEWYLDQSTNYLYYAPLSGQNLATTEVIAGKTVKLFSASGSALTPLRNVILDGITFAYDNWVEPSSSLGYPDFQAGVVYRGAGTWDDNNYMTPAGVSFAYSHRVGVRNSVFTHMANAALSFDAGVQDSFIDYNSFSDISGNGINVGGITRADHHPTNPANIVRDNTISNNTITTVGAEYLDNPGIFLGYTQGSDVRHNTLSNLPYTGISMGWGWGYIDALDATVAKQNVVRGNRIFDFMKTVPDGGAVYTLGNQFGSKVVDNYAYGMVKHVAYLYRDNGSAGFVDSNNVLEKTTSINDWYYTNAGNGGYWNARENIATGNFYTSGMAAPGTGGSNVVTGNTDVASTWPTAAQNVIANAGVGGSAVSSVTAGEIPVSRGRAATASSIYSTTYDAAKAVDGSSSTRWAQASGAADPSSLKVDLGAEYSITATDTDAYLSSATGVKYIIEYSVNNSTWMTFADRTATFRVPGRDTNATAPKARYVRITLTATQGQGGSINEFEVFGSRVALSQGKLAVASSEYSTTYAAGKAVDGDAATRWAQASAAADPSWLQVDFEAVYTIDSTYTDAYLTSGVGVRYKIEYWTTSSTWATLIDRTAAYSTPGLDTFATPVATRYVRITLTDSQGQGGSLREFKVYAS